jgi:replicative DNA helicase
LTETYALDLDWDLISHLALPESIGALRAEQFTAELIEDPIAKKVFEWQMWHYREHGKPATSSVLEDQFTEVTIEPTETSIGDLIERIRARYMRNEGRKIAKQIALAVNETPLEAAKLMLRGGRSLADLTLKRGEVFATGDYHRLMAMYDNKVTQGRGPSLGFKELDDFFNGMLGVTFLIAPPKSCKTWMNVNALRENVIAGKFPYCYSLELPAHEYTQRLLHLTADLPWWKYLKNAIMPDDRNLLKEAADLLDSVGSYRIEKPQPGERGVQRMVERALNAGASCVMIDQLQYVENKKGVNLGSANNTGDYWEVCNDLRDYSDEIPIFVVHQFNRSVMNAKEMPEAQQAKGSAAVEEVATLALGMWGNKEMRKNRILELGTLASRNYDLESWRIGLQFSYGCSLDMLGVVEDDEDE